MKNYGFFYNSLLKLTEHVAGRAGGGWDSEDDVLAETETQCQLAVVTQTGMFKK